MHGILTLIWRQLEYKFIWRIWMKESGRKEGRVGARVRWVDASRMRRARGCRTQSPRARPQNNMACHRVPQGHVWQTDGHPQLLVVIYRMIRVFKWLKMLRVL